MSTATVRAYQPYFAGRFMSSETRKSPQNKDFYGHRDTYSGKAHCIKDRVLLDGPLCPSAIPMLSSPFKILNYQKFVLPPPQS